MATIIAFVQGNLPAVIAAVAVVLASLNILLKYGSHAVNAAFRIAGKYPRDIVIHSAAKGDVSRLADNTSRVDERGR